MKKHQTRHGTLIAILLGAALVGIFLTGPRIDLAPYQPRTIALGEDLEPWLAAKETALHVTRPELQKRVIWANPHKKAPTPLSLIYLHGFTASAREIYPVMETLGKDMRANVFFARLKGHGVDKDELKQVKGTDWMYDAEEALAIGTQIGEKVVVVGTSTGGSLALWLAYHHPQVAAVVLLSPNLGPKDKASEIILLPWGPAIAKAVVGDYRAYGPLPEPANSYFTTRYPTEALFPMMAVVSATRNLNPSLIKTPTLILYTPHDNVVDSQLIERFYDKLGSEKKELVAFPETNTHVLGGDYFNPTLTGRVIASVNAFLSRELIEQRSR